MKVLSLFDGMACGMLAMLGAGLKVDRYVAYEIDKYAVKTSSHNFPSIEHKGDVFEADFTQYKGFDFVVGGSPCTYWSIAQKNNRETEASGMGWELFSQYVRAVKEAQPKFFIYENNKSMSNAIRESITETFGFEPICINSSLVSAQNRQRLYWVGKRNPDGTYSRVNVEQPADRGILLRDVLDGVTDREKGRCVIGSIGRTTTREYFQKNQGTMAYEPVGIGYRGRMEDGKWVKRYESNEEPKANALTTATTDSMCAVPVASTVLNINPSGKGMNGAVGRIDAKSRCLTTNKGEGQKIIVPVESKTVLKAIPEIAEKYGYLPEMFNAYNRAEITDKAPTLSTGSMVTSSCAVNKFEPVAKTEQYAISVGNMYEKQGQNGQLFSIDGKSKTLSAGTGVSGRGIGSSNSPKVCIPVEDPCIYQVPHGFNEGGIKYEKAPTLTANGSWTENNKVICAFAVAIEWSEDGKPTKAISGADGKVYDVYEVKDGQITIKGKQYPIKLADGFYIIRKLTVSECKRLQTVPEWYEFPVSDTQAYKMLGNGWTVQVIVHLINATQEGFTDEPEEQLDLFKIMGV